jgi:hypothetical protein
MQPKVGHYADVPDFIYGITREIWEDRGIGGKLDRYYAPDILLRAATGLTTDNAGVTAQTLQTLHQFPDRQLVGEDVIWNDGGDGSFLSSHRLISVMRHQGHGSYGRATGRLVKTRIIADCWVVDTVVTEEWLARDQAAFARCLGLEPRQLAQQMVDDDLRRGASVGFFLPEHDRPGRYVPVIQDAPEIASYIAGYRRLWQEKETAGVRDLYFHGANLFAPGGDTFCGHVDIDRFYLGYLASFPDAVFSVGSATFRTAHRRAGLRHGIQPREYRQWTDCLRVDCRRRGFYLETDHRSRQGRMKVLEPMPRSRRTHRDAEILPDYSAALELLSLGALC